MWPGMLVDDWALTKFCYDDTAMSRNELSGADIVKLAARNVSSVYFGVLQLFWITLTTASEWLLK